MINKETKNQIIKNFEKYENNSEFIESLKEHILNYEGSNNEAFFNFILQLETLLDSYNIALIESQGYKKLKALENDYQSVLKDLRKEYTDISNGKVPASRAVFTNPSSVLDVEDTSSNTLDSDNNED